MRLVWDFCLPKMFLTIFDYIGTLIHTYKRTPDYSLSNLDQPININFCSWLSMTCIWQKIVLNGMPMIIFDSIHVHHWLPNFNLLSQSLDSRRAFLIWCNSYTGPNEMGPDHTNGHLHTWSVGWEGILLVRPRRITFQFNMHATPTLIT